MGYSTEFRGAFSLTPKLRDSDFEFLKKFSETRRMKRNLGPEFGVEGEFYVDGGGDFGQDNEENIIDYNCPPAMQPSLWCSWVPTDDREHIEWDGSEKFYEYIDWIDYLIKKILKPRGYTVNGSVDWRGEDWDDNGTITVENNVVEASNCWRPSIPEEDTSGLLFK